jgi:hypothetical protein
MSRVAAATCVAIFTLNAIPEIKARQQHATESCFLFVPFVNGARLIVRFENVSKRAVRPKIVGYLPNGSIAIDRSNDIGPKHTADVEIDLKRERPEIGWVKVIATAETRVSAKLEYLTGNELISLPQLPISPHPFTEAAVRSASLYGLRHRYTYNVSALHGVAYVFVNLSPYAVHAGMCQSPAPTCTAPLTRTVGPMAWASFPIDESIPYAVVESTPGFSAGTAIAFSPGLAKVFSANSSITFGQPLHDVAGPGGTSGTPAAK